MNEKTVLAGNLLLIVSQTMAEVSSLLLAWPEEHETEKKTQMEKTDDRQQ